MTTPFSFPKAYRFRKKRDFQALKTGSHRFVGKCICIDFKHSITEFSRLGITASGRYGNSCERNRFKRLAREAFRKTRSEFSPFELHIIPRQMAKTAGFEEIEAELRSWHNSILNKPSPFKP
jgi:ribonuclease P protein component